MQAALEAQAKRLPELHVQRIIARRAKASGIELYPHEAEALAKQLLAGGEGAIGLDERLGLAGATLSLTEEDATEIRALPDRIQAAMTGGVEDLVEKSADILLRSIQKQWPAVKAEHDQVRAALLETVQLLWGDALDKLDMLIATAESVGGQAVAVARVSPSEDRRAVTAALKRLRIRGIQVANEILALLREGSPTLLSRDGGRSTRCPSSRSSWAITGRSWRSATSIMTWLSISGARRCISGAIRKLRPSERMPQR